MQTISRTFTTLSLIKAFPKLSCNSEFKVLEVVENDPGTSIRTISVLTVQIGTPMKDTLPEN